MSLINIAVKRPVTVAMFTLAVILFGMVSLSRLAITLLPDLAYPSLTVRTDYNGAAPAEIEQLINRPIEEAVGTVRGVRNITSIARAGQSDVLLEFQWGTDMDMASLDVREKLDSVLLPLDVEKPLILRLNPSMDPIMRLALSLPERDTQPSENELRRLRTYADEDLKRQLESVTGVASVRFGGGLEDEIHIQVDQARLAQFDIDMTTLVERLRAENVNRAGGRVETERHDYLVRTLNQFSNLDDMRAIYIATRNGRQLQLRDVAVVEAGAKDRTSITRLGGAEAVEVSLYKEGDANTVAVAEAVQQRLQQIRKQLPDDYSVQVISDQSGFIAGAISEVKNNALLGGLLAMLVIFLFLKKLWPTLIISLAIPVSVIATFTLMHAAGLSLNIMSLGGIALAIGLLVDNAIVVLENIARRRALGDSVQQAAAQGTREVASAITAATLTTLAVFVPLIFVSGLAGQLFKDQALTVTFALLASLLVALTLIPMLASRQANRTALQPGQPTSQPARPRGWRRLPYFAFYLPWRGFTFWLPVLIIAIGRRLISAIGLLAKGLIWPLLWLFDRAYRGLETLYYRTLKMALQHAWVTLSSIILIAALCLSLVPRLGTELMPDMSQHEFYFDIELPHGSHIAQTDRVLRELTQATLQHPGVSHSYTIAGTGSLMNPSSAQGGDYWGRLQVVMQPDSTEQQQRLLQQQLRDELLRHPGVSGQINRPALFAIEQPLVVELSGYELASLARASETLVADLAAIPRFADVQSTLRSGQPEIEVRFDHARLAQAGLNSGDVSELLAMQIGGRVATQYNLNDRQIDIRVRLQSSDRNDLAAVENLIINPGESPQLPLRAVADIRMATGPSEITRVAQQRVALVSASLSYGDLGEATAEVRDVLAASSLPYGISAHIAGQSEAQASAYQSLLFALALAVFLVYLVMASQFESLGHPLLIMFTVPLAAAGSVLGLWLTGTYLSVVVFIGLIMLAGIVVNNAIVLVDCINQLRAQGLARLEAIQTGAQQRLRPIVMTSLTTILGLLPLALGAGDGAEMRAPMAITVIFGLLFASLLTLLFIPVLYQLFDRKKFATEVTHG
ncbi:efflux RND transporter permease subunit [Aliidiomarina sp. Khilg15.8]